MSYNTLFGTVPQDWVVCKLSEIAQFRQGLQISKSERISQKASGYIPLLKVTDLPKGIFSEYVTNIRENYIATKKDVIYTRTGIVGEVYTNVTGCVHNNCFKVITSPDIIDKNYLFYYLNSKQVKEYSNSVAAGSVQKDLNHGAFGSLVFAYPPLKNQIKIANILSSLDDKIELNNKINKILEELAQTLYKRWFVDFEFPNEDGEPYKSSGGKMVDSEFGTLPKGWSVKTLEDLSSNEKNAIVDGPFGTQMKISEYVESGIPIIEMYQLNGYENVEGYKNFITEDKYQEVKRSTVKNGDIIISKTGTLGLLGLLNRKTEKAILVSRLAKITPNVGLIKSSTMLVLMHYLSDSGHWYQIASGSTMPLLNIGNIKKTKIVFPNENIISYKFDSIVSDLIEKINTNLRENFTLSRIRDELLPRLMNGEIEVPIEE